MAEEARRLVPSHGLSSTPAPVVINVPGRAGTAGGGEPDEP